MNQRASGRLAMAAWPALLAVAVFIASGQSQVAAPGFIPSLDKLAHFAVFGLFATLTLRVFHVEERPWRSALIALAITSLYGFADECRQSFTPGRSVEVADWASDTLGALVAAVAYTGWPAWRRLLERRLRPDPIAAGEAPAQPEQVSAD